MDLTNKTFIKQILQNNKIWPKKGLGQNFLVCQEVLDKIVEAANIQESDNILEIGPGLGVLTWELSKRAKLVLAVERDRKLVELLRKQFKGKKNVKIVCDDILAFNNLTKEQFNNYKIVANIPYQITSPLIRKFIFSENPPKQMVLLVQKEVAERICAKPGDSSRGLLTIFVEFFADAQILQNVGKECFWPVPGVDSAVIKIRIRTLESGIRKEDEKSFFRLVKIGFSQKRRQIHNPLIAGLHMPKNIIYDILERAEIDKKLRAEDLNLDDWFRLFKTLQKNINNKE